jgi:hypothetical protein
VINSKAMRRLMANLPREQVIVVDAVLVVVEFEDLRKIL